MKLNKKTFFNLYRAKYGALIASQVQGLDFLLDKFVDDSAFNQDIRFISYALATVKHECGDTYQPIEEWGKGKGKPYHDGGYWGRGHVQLTWLKNYQLMSIITGVDLVKHPEKALEPEIAYKIMSHGMVHGSFTNKKLSDYIGGSLCDYFNCRRIINGTDKAKLIAEYAIFFESILKKSLV